MVGRSNDRTQADDVGDPGSWISQIEPEGPHQRALIGGRSCMGGDGDDLTEDSHPAATVLFLSHLGLCVMLRLLEAMGWE